MSMAGWKLRHLFWISEDDQRIEDDVRVTAGECEVLTAEAPKAIAEIEALIRDGRR
jgi:hypothetical protein